MILGREKSVLDAPVDSREGIEHLTRWAKAHGFVLNEWHEEIAHKHGVSTEGVIYARQIPTGVRFDG